MTRFDFKTVALSSLGTLVLATTCVGAAVAPARAAAPDPSPAAWQQRVGDRVSAVTDSVASRLGENGVAEPVLTLRFDAAGDFIDANLARPSGVPAVDAQALAVARTTRYPAMPAALRGTPRTVTLRLAFGRADAIDRYRRAAGPAPRAAADGFQVAAR